MEKTKKKLGKGKLALIIVGSVIGAILLAVALFFLITALTNKNLETNDLVLTPSKPAFESTISAELQNKIDVALNKNATKEEKAAAAIALYKLANQNKINAKQCVMIAQGSGTANVGGIATGEMTVRAFKVQDNGTFYYQKGAKLMSAKMGAADLPREQLALVLDQQERSYVPADSEECRAINLKGASANVPEEFTDTLPFLSLGTKDRKDRLYDEYEETLSLKEFYNTAFVLEDPKEINNFNYNEDSITEITFEYNKEGYYDITFTIRSKDDNTVEVARAYLRKSSNSEDLEFNSYSVNLKIWDNGYIRSFKDWEEWEGNAEVSVAGINASGKSSSKTWYEGAFYWNYESLVADGIISADNAAINKDNYAKDLINKYASQPGWVTAE